MLDHILGRPSVQFRKTQVLTVVSFWSIYLYRGNHHGPPALRLLSARCSRRLTAWQTVVITMLWLYIARNLDRILGLECPEPLANLYTRSYFRATWITTALDAGFWSAMRINRKWMRDLCSIVFSIYYLFCAEQADQKVRRMRATLTVDHLRVSWNKGTTPYLAFMAKMMRPRLMRHRPRALRIPRPTESSYREPIMAWLYFDKPLSALKGEDKVVLDIPGGGWVAMDPRNHDDKLMAWAAKTGVPVLSLDYKKAPEYPYPYALHECYDAYHTIVSSRGRCIGFSGRYLPKVIISGDSAGGNLAVGMTLMILQSASTNSRLDRGERQLPPPTGIVLVYPALDMNIGNWMTEEQMALIRDRRSRSTNKPVLRRKSDDYRKLDPSTPYHSDEDEDGRVRSSSQPFSSLAYPTEQITVKQNFEPRPSPENTINHAEQGVQKAQQVKPHTFKTRLAMSSILSYFNDRILTPEMMRAMIILYIGPHHRPDFSTDYFLSPLLAPEQLLARFPKTHFLTGERDPLVDDTVIFAGRIRQAKLGVFTERKDMGLIEPSIKFVDHDHVEVVLIPGISHGFLQFVGVFPEGWNYIFRAAKWMRETFNHVDKDANRVVPSVHIASDHGAESRFHRPNRTGMSPLTFHENKYSKSNTHYDKIRTESSGDEDRPLEMTKPKTSTSRALIQETSGVDTFVFDKGRKNMLPSNRIDHHVQEGRRKLRGTGARTRKKSLVSLASEDDLLGRRMKGLTGGLIGGLEIKENPPTPGEKTVEHFF